jgi:hypothetical protein
MRYFSVVVRIEQWIRIRCKVISGIRIRIKVMGIRIRLVTQTRMQIRIQVSKIMRINADPGPLLESYFSVLYINFSKQFIEKSIKLPLWPDPDLH